MLDQAMRRLLSRALRLLCAAVLVMRPSISAAQEQVDLPAQIELPRLVDLAAERLGINVEYEPKLAGQVTLRLGGGITDAELWQLNNRLLVSRGYTTVRMGEDETLSVVGVSSAAGVARIESVERFLAESSRPSAAFRSVVVPLRRVTPQTAIDVLKPFLSTAGSVTSVPDIESVIISDVSARVVGAIDVLRTLDSSELAMRVLELPLQHLAPEELIALSAQLEAKRVADGEQPLRGQLVPAADGSGVLLLAPQHEFAAWRSRIEQLDQRAIVSTETYTSSAFTVGELADSVQRIVGADDPRFRVIADDLTGSLVVTATSEQHDLVQALLDRVAELPEATRRPTRTFPLANRDAQELLTVLQTLVAGGVLESPAAGGTADPAGGLPTARARAAPGDDRMMLAADATTNSVIAIGQPAELERLARLIADLDVRRPQVLLEVLIISLSESAALDLGVEIEAAINGPNDTVAKLASLFGLSSTGAGSAGIEGNRGAGFTGIVLNPGDFSVVLRALKNLNEGRSLSIPKVLVASNEQASINSVLEQPYTTLNASDTVATTSFGGSSNAGTEVSVTPQIAKGDHLRLEYQVSLSAFVGEAADASVPPPKQQNSIDSVATIPDGYTIAVGGIELTTEGYSETGIPLLSDVPILGEAFKNRSKSSSRSRFYVFIRPTILRDRDFEDLKYLSDRDVADTGIDDGWPVPEPRLIR